MICGTKTMTNSSTMSTSMNGMRCLITASSRTFATCAPTKSTGADGGEMTAIERLKTIMMPKCTGSMPYETAMGRKIGVKMRIAGVGSSGMPMTSSSSIMMSSTTTFESVHPNSASDMSCGSRA